MKPLTLSLSLYIVKAMTARALTTPTTHRLALPNRKVAFGVLTLLAIAFVGYAFRATLAGPANSQWDAILYCGIVFVSAGMCATRALLVSRERLAWAMMGGGLTLWG